MGLGFGEVVPVPAEVAVGILDGPELLVGADTGSELHQAGSAAGWHHHPARLGQMGRHLMDGLALPRGLAHQPHLAHGQVPQPAMDQLRRARRRASGEVVPLHQGHPQPTMSRIPGPHPRR